MYFNDRDAVAEQLEPILKIPYISYIVVENQKDSVFYSSDFQRAAEKNYTQIEQDFISEDGSTYKIETPIVFNYEQLGNIYIGYSLQMINSEIDKIQGQIVYISIILFILGVIAAYFFADHILEPLLKIVKASKEITLGKLKARAAVLTKDEIGKLAESFNEMVDKLDRAQEELEQRVKERTKELEAALISLQIAKEKAEQSDRLKTEFLSQMSHEIRTPINVFLNYASLVQMELEENEHKQLEEDYKVMESASRRLIRTIDLMLNFSEVQSNSYVCKNKQIDIYNDILVDLAEEYSISAGEKGLDLLLIERKEPEHIYADKYTVTQIFRNLIENAIKYTDEGKVELKIRSHNDKKLSVTVADTGIGISKEYLEDLFEPFRQEDQGNTRKYQGNGLALALVKKYCDLNNADVNVESKKGKGSKFTVTFNR
jgi:signal transduction histidine kinase